MLKTWHSEPANSLAPRPRASYQRAGADRGFLFWPEIETVEIALVDDISTVLQVLAAVKKGCVFG